MGTVQDSLADPFQADAGADGFADSLQVPASVSTQRAPRTAVGEFVGHALDESPLVRVPSVLAHEVLRARATIGLRRADRGAQVVVVFEEDDPRRPIIIGLLDAGPDRAPGPQALSLEADGERHTITAEREIVLRCGDASITLTRAGKVIIQGNYVLTRSTGPNKIKGAVIDIN